MMKRAVIAAFWIAGTTVPMLLAGVLKFSCCALPAMPFCHMAPAAHDTAQTPAPAPEKQEPVKRIVTSSSFVLRVMDEPRVVVLPARTAFRSFITLGATRCDRDVGLHVILATLLI